MQETQKTQPRVHEDPLEKEMPTHSSILAWGILRREEPGRLQPVGSQSRTHWVTEHSIAQEFKRSPEVNNFRLCDGICTVNISGGSALMIFIAPQDLIRVTDCTQLVRTEFILGQFSQLLNFMTLTFWRDETDCLNCRIFYIQDLPDCFIGGYLTPFFSL